MRDEFEAELDPNILNMPSFSDLEFIDDNGVPTAAIIIEESGQNGRIISLRVIKHPQGQKFSVGQISDADIGEDTYDLRNIRIFMNEFGVPNHIAVTDNMIGPTNAVGVVMIMKLVHATFSNDSQYRQESIDYFNLSAPHDHGSDRLGEELGEVIPLFS